MSYPLVSARSRRFVLVFALATATALPSAAAERRPRARPATAEAIAAAPAASSTFGDFFEWLIAEWLGIPVATVFSPIIQRSEVDSEIEVDPPNPVVPASGGNAVGAVQR